MFNRFYFVHKRKTKGVLLDEREKKKSNTGGII